MSPDFRPRLRALHIEAVELDGQNYLAFFDQEGFAPDCALPVSHAPFLRLFDGTRSLDEIWIVVQDVGALERAWFDDLVAQLDDAFLLDSPRFRSAKRERERDFVDSPLRPAALAGRSYPADSAELRAFMAAKLYEGQERLPAFHFQSELVRGIVTPHIDFNRGGHTEAASYEPLVQNVQATGKPFDTLVILGIAHAGLRFPFSLLVKDFATPLGTMKCDHRFAADLEAHVGPDLVGEPWAHKEEHSIEFSAVWCQFFPELSNAQIVPILCGGFWESLQTRRAPEEAEPEVAAFIAALREVTQEHEANGKKIGFIASVDGAHVGTQFGDSTRLTSAKLSLIEREDHVWCDHIAHGDKHALHAHFARDGNQFNVDAHPALYTLLAAFPSWRGQLLDYDQAFHPDQNIVVSFASLALFENGI